MSLSVSEQKRLLNRYGPWAVVTGSTSGIGLETARLLSEAGFNLLLCARNSDDLNATAAALPGQCLVVSADLSTEAGIHRLVDAAGNLDAGLFYHAAGYGTSGLFVDSDVAQEANMWRLNTGSVLHLTHYFSRVFKEKRRGGVVLLGSIVGFQGVPYAAHYAATKAYVQSLGEGTHHEDGHGRYDQTPAASRRSVYPVRAGTIYPIPAQHELPHKNRGLTHVYCFRNIKLKNKR